MDLIVIGIDGGTASIFDYFEMPFWKELRSDHLLLPMTEDLVQRGWAKMVSGSGAEETGGLYMYPKADRSMSFTPRFDYAMMSQTPGFMPIWAAALSRGERVGIMNVPTTAPAQKVEGFYVSGGGGGVFQGGMPADSVYPAADTDLLRAAGYIFDVRLGAESYRSANRLCDRLVAMMQARAEAFISQAKRHDVSFGFVAFRATTVLLYLAMSEVAELMQERDARHSNGASTGWSKLIHDHMSALDDVLRRIIVELSPRMRIIASDHDIVPWTHRVDFNGFLTENGFAQFDAGLDRLGKNVGRAVRESEFRKRLRAASPEATWRTLRTAHSRVMRSSTAFSAPYVHGMYVNDEARFGGPVEALHVPKVVESIVETFNGHSVPGAHGLVAEAYRSRFGGARQSDMLPDVKVSQSGFAFPSELGDIWLQENANFGPIESVRGVSGMHTGQKGRHPVLLVDSTLASLVDDRDVIDLSLVYRLVRRAYDHLDA